MAITELQIAECADDGDLLAATTNGTGITATYNSSTETLTLTGVDTP